LPAGVLDSERDAGGYLRSLFRLPRLKRRKAAATSCGRVAAPRSARIFRVALDKSEGVVKRHSFAAMLGSTE